MGILSALIQNEIERVLPPPPKPKLTREQALAGGRSLGPKIKQQKADKRYLDMLADGGLPTGTIASRLGISHMGCLNSLYSLEERKLIKRATKRGAHKAIIWELA